MIGRNDPCPCGSGKKYKKCCLLFGDKDDFKCRRWRQIEARLITRLIKFSSEILEPEVIEDAWKDFNDTESVADRDPRSAMNMVFMPWFLFTWTFDLKPTGSKQHSETTVAELFLRENADSLSSDEKMLLLSAICTPYTLCEVVEVKPGIGMTQFDLLRRIKYEVIERSASQSLKRGEIIYCATTDMAGIKSNIGTSPYALRPTAKRDVLELRKWILDETGADDITADHLHEFDQDIRGLYLHLLRGMFTPPRLANTDGDPIVPHKVYFDIDSANDAFHALKDLAEGEQESDLLKDAVIEDGLVTEAEISWLGGKEEARRRHDGPILLGLLKIEENRLIVEVNSELRASLIRQLIEERLGKGARYETTLIEPIESQVQEMWQAAAAGRTGSSFSGGFRKPESTGFISLDEEQPELRAIIEESAKRHWESWFDLPVPALNDMTPREAAKSEEGRDLLESLLLLYESHQDDPSTNLMTPDIPALRRELGMD